MTDRKIALAAFGLAVMVNMTMAEEVSLTKDLMPLFARSCTGCHQRENGNKDAIKDGVYLEKKEDILKSVGTLVVTGKPDDSYLLQVLKKAEDKPEWIKTMPPPRSKAPRMSEDEIKTVANWIKAGAKDN